jgi:hypothetical protein
MGIEVAEVDGVEALRIEGTEGVNTRSIILGKRATEAEVKRSAKNLTIRDI